MLKENPEMSKCDIKKFINEIEIVEREIHGMFGEFNNIEGISFVIKQSVSTKFKLCLKLPTEHHLGCKPLVVNLVGINIKLI